MDALALILDFDGVIVESVDIKAEAFVELFSNYPEHCSAIRRYQLSNGGVSRFEKFRYIYHNIFQQELTKDDEVRLSDAFSSLVVNRIVDCPYVAGAEEVLRRYSRMKKLFVVSATPETEVKTIVRRRGIDGYFTGVFGTPMRKVEHIRRIMQENAFSPEDLIVVGDSLEDSRAAEECGIRFIGRVRRGHQNVFDSIHMNYIIEDMFGLIRVLEHEE